MVKVAINGFGRIGRMVLRAGLKEKNIDFVAINDLSDVETLAHLLKYDSVHGRLDADVKSGKGCIIINGKKVSIFSEKDPEKLPWKNLKIDVVVESTGFFTKREDAEKHIKAGAKKVLLSAPGKGENQIPTVVMGANQKMCKNDNIISNASCTTNSLVPVVQVLDKEFGIDKGFMTTIHSYTNDQKILDLPHKDLRRARAAAMNIIPTTTGAATAVTEVFTNLKGKLDGTAIRVPTPCGSLTDFTCLLKKNATVDQVNNAMKKASQTYLKGILEYSEEALVSTDIIGNPHSGIFDATLTKVNGNLVKVFSWYDNEWGYSTRMVDMIKIIGKP
ncbi:MAG: type I glyceraldehyde-3-phosphate dehydrogenase [Candidatus Woesearchaeota archaeon]